VKSSDDENFIIWIKQNEEGELLKKLLPNAVEVKGSDSQESKEDRLLGFANNEFSTLVTKSKIAQFGLNYQNCHNQIFASLDFSFEALYQSIRRSYRFGQKKPVNIFLITTDTMANVIQSINKKQKQFKLMQDEMAKAINENLNNVTMLESSYDTEEVNTASYHIKRGDCVQLIKEIHDESVGLSIFSPPFAELYTYSSHLEDMGNSKDYNEFMVQFGFLVGELYRVLKQGRNVAVHCMDIPIQKGKEGFIGLRDFSGLILRCFEDAGFIYHSRVTIWKDPVTEMQRTKALGLLHKQVKKDSTMSRVGIPDYLLIFRKDGDRSDPVNNTDLPVDLWQKYASPVWMDIDQGDTLQGFRNARDEKDEKHICPLQLQTIERAIHLYTNKGDTVLSPFAGIGSEVYQAVKMDRVGIGFELKESYFDMMKRNMTDITLRKKQSNAF
jgi:DNA modification methylase